MPERRLNILLVPVGSAGDVHPFIGLGHELRRRGHDVTVFTNGYFESLVSEAGFKFVEFGTEAEFREVIGNPNIWKASPKSAQLVFGMSAEKADVQFDLIMQHNLPGSTVIAAGSLAFGARMANEKLDIPLGTVHLSPSLFTSVHDMPRLPVMNPPAWAPKFIKRFFWKMGDRVIGKKVLPTLNTHRRRIGLPPTNNIILDWWHSPQLILAMFPDWFGEPQPDWPAQAKCVGFPLYDERREQTISDTLNQWLISGDAPIAFTPGSANVHARNFFRAAVGTCEKLKRRGVLLTRHEQQLPDKLPASIRHVQFAPFSELLPRCAALVSHGGIGTVSQAIAAGIPQIVMPLAHDQFDNARRLETLGIGTSIPPHEFKADRVARTLKNLLGHQQVRSNCSEYAGRLRQVDALAESASLLEGLVVK